MTEDDYKTEVARLTQERDETIVRSAKFEDECERMRAAIRWALGEAPDSNGKWFGDAVPPLEAKYWWRTTLRRMAGMGDFVYDKARRTVVARVDQQGPPPLVHVGMDGAHEGPRKECARCREWEAMHGSR